MTDQNQIEIYAPTAIDAATRAEVDIQVSTAKRYPRDIARFQASIAATVADPEIAASCYYSLPRAGKKIEGPSVRLAEIVAAQWGNLRCETRITEIGDKQVTARATVWDTEKNYLKSDEVRRRITDSQGRRYSDDMIQQTCQATMSIAFRNCIFDVIPFAFVQAALGAAKKRAAGDDKKIAETRKRWIDYFARLKVGEAEVAALLDVASMGDATLDDCATLQGLANAIRDGQTTIDQTFGPRVAADQKQQPAFGFAGKESEAKNGKA